MQTETESVLSKLVPLKPLDLSGLDTVGKIVDEMKFCAFGARNLGEVCTTVFDWARFGLKPTVVYGGYSHNLLGNLLYSMRDNGWFSAIKNEEEFIRGPVSERVIVIGSYPERIEELLSKSEQIIFINQYGMAFPGHLQEGYYPNFIHGDPNFIVPVLNAYLEEKLLGRASSATELICHMKNFDGLGSKVFEGMDVISRMTDDPDCTVFLTISGAMTIAKMGLSFTDLIEKGKVQAITTTGALMAHGLIENMGLVHYKHNPDIPDAVLARLMLNRVTDTLEPESNLDEAEEVMAAALKEIHIGNGLLAPTEINRLIGKYICNKFPETRGILMAAYRMKVPVFVPAFHDSELGNDLLVYNHRLAMQGIYQGQILIDQELDSWKLIKMTTQAKKLGIISIGGGVPRNYIQNIAPLVDILNQRLKLGLVENQFSYGVRICPEPPVYGNLSGCTYSEGITWRKFRQDALKAEIQADATLVWPFLARSVLFE